MNIFTHLKAAIWFLLYIQPVFLFAQPSSNRSDIQIKELGVVKNSSVRIVQDPSTGNLYVLENTGNINRVDIGADGKAVFTTVYTTADHTLTAPLGMAFAKDGTLFLVGTETNGQNGVSIIMKGTPVTPGSESRNWSVLAKTVQYLYGFTYNHRMSGIAVDPKGDFIYVNSGARTDHGEIREGFREVGLTACILKLPVNGSNIVLQDDREWLKKNGYIMAEGIRNDFGMAFNSNGDLISVENSGDRDDPDEMNWLREGHHYGFPWRMGGDITPQQFKNYNPRKDPLLNPNAWGGGNLYQTFSNDSTYPKPPDSITFTEPIASTGPDADKFRDTVTGVGEDASNLGKTISTFTPHRSPDGIVFDRDSLLAGDLRGGGFVISVNSGGLMQPLGDTGEDLLLVSLTKGSDNYTAKVTRLISGFTTPLGIELVKNKLYVVETGLWTINNPAPKLWEITLPANFTTGVEKGNAAPETYKLYQNYPNPFNPSTRISFSLPKTSFVTLKVFNVLGQQVETLLDNALYSAGEHQINFSGTNLSSGTYIYTIEAGGFKESKAMILMK